MAYVNGIVCAVPDANREAFVRTARIWAGVCRDHGALEVVDCWGADVPDGKLTSFPMAVKVAPGESVVFSWIRWPDRATCDAAWPKMMQDPRMSGDMPLDGARMIYGGFDVVSEG